MTRRPCFAVIAVAAVLTACASAATPSERAPAGGAPSAGFPGFDTRVYPGDAAMAQWRARSPYRWVGFYLPAPCYTGASWLGKRAALERMGWGTALVFVGEQDWPAGGEPAPDSVPARCTRANVTATRGAADGEAAAAAALAEGFARRSVIYLDVERVERVSPALAGYAGAWALAVRAGGFRAGLYAHARNAVELREAMDATAAGVPLWVASEAGFDLAHPPSASGIADADVWQGSFDVSETWGDATLRVDRNVASRASPSAPR